MSNKNNKNKEEIIEIIDNIETNENKKKEKKQKEKKIKEEKNKQSKDKNKETEKEKIIDDDFKELKSSKPKKLNTSKIFSFILSLIAIICFIIYIVLEIINYKSILNNLPSIISSSLILLFILCFIILGLKNKNNKSNGFVILGSLILIIYSLFNIFLRFNIISLPNDNSVLNFYNKTITYGKNWAIENNIEIKEIYEYSDVINEYHIISQDIESGTLIKDINKITFIISSGPNYQKEVIVPSFIGWNFDDVIKYIEENFLNNVEINFIESSNTPNTVINQVGSGTIKRNDLIKLDFAKDEISSIEVIDFTNKSLLYSTSWLKMHGFKYELEYVYNDNIKKDYVVSQSVKNEVKDPNTETIKLTISKGKMIVMPDINEMDQDELNKWIMDNDLKVNYKEIYNEEIPSGDIIESDRKEGDVIETGNTINVVISKGKLEMIKLTTLTNFYIWADQNNISYDIEYQFNNTIKKDEIIKASHNTGELIKTDDTVIIYVSKGKSVTIPNFVSMSKTSIQNKCNELNLSCSFTYGGYTETIKKDIATKQSKASGTTVAEGTNLVITLSSGIYEKVNIPNYIGKSKTDISSSCKNLGLVCNFVYESSFSSTKKDIATKQSKTGKVNKGSSLTITLSKGPAKTYTVVIDPNQLTAGNANATKATLKKKLESACPGVTFTFTLQKANSAIGYLAENSQVKVGQNTFTQGKTYKVIINSN